LDDDFQITQSAGYLRAYKGNWDYDSTFVINYQVLDYSERGKLIIKFENEKLLNGWINEYVENVNHKITGRITN
jgi:hypothetical protein